MTRGLLLALGGLMLVLFCAAATFLLRDIRRQERIVARVRTIHGHPPEERTVASAEDIRVAAMGAIASFGQAILRSGLVPARTRAELEQMLAASGLRGQQGVGVFLGCKILTMAAVPFVAWMLTRDMQLAPMLHTIIPPAAGVFGLLLPDWLIGRQRKRYQDRLERGLPDALDMMVICAQAGLGLGPAIIRVAGELGQSYREIGLELGQTANELQIMTDSRIALSNLGTRTGLDPFRRLATTLIQTIQYGTPLSDALRALSAELRLDSLTKLEERAARLPVMLTMPMIFFILPCVFLIAGGPAMIQVMQVFGN
jgi:tight adherence protein C